MKKLRLKLKSLQYQKLFKFDNVELVFEDDAVDAIATKAFERKTGARGLRSIMESFMTKIMYDVPSRDDIEEVIITEGCVRRGEYPKLVMKAPKLSAPQIPAPAAKE